MNDANSAGQFSQVLSDPGARGMMDANDFKPSPTPLNGDSSGTYNNQMSQNFKNQKGAGMKVLPLDKTTMKSSTWSLQQ